MKQKKQDLKIMSPSSRADEREQWWNARSQPGHSRPGITCGNAGNPPHLFVPLSTIVQHIDDNPLPIGSGQTISQPYIVALMTELLHPKATDTVLEIGAGCGYQAAILSRLVKQLTTIERITTVANLARRNLKSIGIDNVMYRWRWHTRISGQCTL